MNRLSLSSARFPAGVNIWVRWAEVVMDKTDFGASSILGSWEPFDTLDESVLKAALGANRLLTEGPRIVSLRWANVENLNFSNADLRACRFAGSHNLDRLRLEGGSAFAVTPRDWRVTSRQAIAEEQEWRAHYSTPLRARGWYAAACAPPDDVAPPRLAASDVAAIYRDLRKGREDNKDEPGAADFYYGEMEMRRLGGSRTVRRAERATGRAPTNRGEHAILTLYWLTSGYALRASRALVSLAVTVFVFAIMLDEWGFQRDQSFISSLTFAVESTTSLFRAPERRLTITGEWLQIGLRLLGPLFFGLALFSLRGRVKR